MTILHRLFPSTPGAHRRALILILYVVILGAAVTLQAHQNRADTVYLTLRSGVAYAQALDSEFSQPLFPLAAECQLRWTNGTQGASIAQEDVIYPNTGSASVLHFATVGEIDVSWGMPWVTIGSKLGNVQVMADCPPPAPTTHHGYVYALGEHLFFYDTLDEQRVLLMPLKELLLWTGDETYTFTLDLLVTRSEDRAGYDWLPQGATVLGDFETADEISIKSLDETQVQLRYGDHELMLVSYDRWAR